MSRRLNVLMLPALLLSAQLTVVVFGQGPAGAGGCAASVVDSAAATAMAKACGARVEVESARTEYSEVYAEPSGGRTVVSSFTPQRARRIDGRWGAVDTSLRLTDGQLAPVAAASHVRFSLGGDGPFVSLSHEGHTFTMAWPGTLPAPTVQGDSATYAEVLPGVDLVVQATATGFSHLLMVKNATAAANPAVRSPRYLLGGDASLVSTPEGGLVASAGRSVVATAGEATMWDTVRKLSPKQLALEGIDSEAPRAEAKVGVRVAGGELALHPDAGMLTAAARFPIVIDPLFVTGQNRWAYATSNNENGPTTDSTISSGDPSPAAAALRVGNDPSTARTYRSFIQFPLVAGGHDLRGKQIISASVSGRVDHTWKCGSNRPTHFFRTAAIGTTPRQSWPGPGLQWHVGNNNVHANEDSCNEANMVWEVPLTGDMQQAADTGLTTYTLCVCAGDNTGGTNETNQERWMRYFLNDFRINVTYNTKPNRPDALTVDGKPCASGAGRPFIKTTTPTLRAHVTDNDGDTMQVWFAWAKWNGSSFVDEPGGGAQNSVPNNGTALYTATGNVDGGIYTFRSQSNDGRLASDVTSVPGNCEWQVDTTAPAAPTVTSDVYGEGQTKGAPGKTGRFTLTSSADTQSFLYGFTDPPTIPLTPAAVGGSVVLDYTPASSGPKSLFVRAVDRAGNEANKTYQFTVSAETTALARWQLNDAPGTTDLADETGNAVTARLLGGTLGAPGRIAPGPDGSRRSALSFDGVDDRAETAAPLIADTSKSFSVSAWVKLGSLSTSRVAVGQGNVFWLEYANSKWQFRLPSATPAVSTTAAKANVWTHLTGTYDSAARQIKLYVNGGLEATVDGVTNVDDSGVFVIGTSWAGSLATVQAWDRMISAAEVFGLYDPVANALVAKWDMSDVGPGPTYDASNLAHDLGFFPQPGGPQIPPAGSGHTGTGLSLDGIDDNARTAEPVLYTDQSFTVSIWVNLSTSTSFTGNRTAISQYGTTESAFYLKYEATQNKWMFVYGDVESGSPTGITADSAGTAVKGTWTHLVGVYDAQAGQIKLYVNGALQDTEPVSFPWNATGGINIGRVLWRGVHADPWPGSIDEIRIYQGAITDLTRIS